MVSFPGKKYAYAVTERSDGFIVGLLLTAMKLKENIKVAGAVSPRLAFGIEEWQRVFNRWEPETFFSDQCAIWKTGSHGKG